MRSGRRQKLCLLVICDSISCKRCFCVYPSRKLPNGRRSNERTGRTKNHAKEARKGSVPAGCSRRSVSARPRLCKKNGITANERCRTNEKSARKARRGGTGFAPFPLPAWIEKPRILRPGQDFRGLPSMQAAAAVLGSVK